MSSIFGVAKYLNGHCSNSVIEATFIRMSKDNRDIHVSPIGKPIAQATLRGLMISRRAAVSSNLLSGTDYFKAFPLKKV